MSDQHVVALAEPQVAYGPTGLELREGLAFEEWERIGGVIGQIHRGSLWWIGDWINYGERHYGETYAQALESTGLDYQTVANAAWVAKRWEFSRRRENLSFSHHEVVAALPDVAQDEWLDLAVREDLSSKALRLRRSMARTRGESGPRDEDASESGVLPSDVQVSEADASRLPLPGESVDLIVTSPPYGLGIDYADTDDDQGYGAYMACVRDWARELYRVAAPQGRLCLNVPIDVTRGGQQAIYADWLEALRVCGWRYRFTIIWTEGGRGNVGKSVARGSMDSPAAPHVTTGPEVVLVCHKGDWNLRRIGPHDLEHDAWLDWTNGVWEIPAASPSAVGHPAPFPEELVRRCVALFSFRGDVVLDPFVGSGTTAVVAARMGRRVYGFDHSPEYVAKARARVAREQAA